MLMNKPSTEVGAGVISEANLKLKKVCKRVAWADEVGRNLTSDKTFQSEEVSRLRPCPVLNGGGRVDTKHVEGKVELFSVKDRQRGVVPERGSRGSSPRRGSYKVALLSSSPRPSSSSPHSQVKYPLLVSRGLSPLCRLGKGAGCFRCFRCLAPDHRVANCRDPVRCLACRRTGHRAFQCKRSVSEATGAKNMNPN